MELKEIGNLELFGMLTRLNKSIANAAALGIDVSAFRSARNDVDDEIFTRFSTVIHTSWRRCKPDITTFQVAVP